MLNTEIFRIFVVMEKYYIPSIEELHEGFEIHVPTIARYEKHILTKEDLINACKFGISREVVKYLDKEDIEELGWGKGKFLNHEFYEFSTFFGEPKRENQWTLRFWKKLIANQYNCIITQTTSGHSRFLGEIKNKSELKRLMKQLNIL